MIEDYIVSRQYVGKVFKKPFQRRFQGLSPIPRLNLGMGLNLILGEHSDLC